MFQLRVETKRNRLACAVKAVSFVFTCYKYALYTFSLSKRDLSLVLRKKRLFAYAKKKDADQLRGNGEADQRLCFRYTDSTIPLLSKYEISSL